MAKPLKFRIGQIFGWLTIEERIGSSPRGVLWKCRCRCGKELRVLGWSLTLKQRTSCGCRRGTLHFIHGLNNRNSAEHRTWNAMLQRCHNPKSTSYKYYGARGISVCKRWRSSFLAFLSDMGKKPSPKMSIERVDNDGNYRPDNCKWATRAEQRKSQRNGKLTPEGWKRRSDSAKARAPFYRRDEIGRIVGIYR
jgi:hypothetical protein